MTTLEEHSGKWKLEQEKCLELYSQVITQKSTLSSFFNFHSGGKNSKSFGKLFSNFLGCGKMRKIPFDVRREAHSSWINWKKCREWNLEIIQILSLIRVLNSPFHASTPKSPKNIHFKCRHRPSEEKIAFVKRNFPFLCENECVAKWTKRKLKFEPSFLGRSTASMG